MKPLIDMHSHIAWGIDDGMPSMDDAVKSLIQAKNDGIGIILSTPHCVPGQTDEEGINAMYARQKELWILAKQYGIKVYPGAEVFMNDFFTESLDNGWYRTINGTKYLLVEYDVTNDIHTFSDRDEWLYEIRIRDMIPVLAHAERYFHKGVDWDIVNQWRNDGTVIQMNRTSLMGYHGDLIKKNAVELLHAGMIDMVVTDTHRSFKPRWEMLSDAYQWIETDMGEETADLLFRGNPAAVLKGEAVTHPSGKAGKETWLERTKKLISLR